MTTYAEKLRDPRWQKKRLEILSRDDFKCRCCGNGTKTLHVHHCFYMRGRDPWDYPIGSLVTLCEDCHADETAFADSIYSDASHVFRLHGCMGLEVERFTTSMNTLGEEGQLARYLWLAADAIEDKSHESIIHLVRFLLSRVVKEKD